jgi:hypothetical protein
MGNLADQRRPDIADILADTVYRKGRSRDNVRNGHMERPDKIELPYKQQPIPFSTPRQSDNFKPVSSRVHDFPTDRDRIMMCLQ